MLMLIRDTYSCSDVYVGTEQRERMHTLSVVGVVGRAGNEVVNIFVSGRIIPIPIRTRARISLEGLPPFELMTDIKKQRIRLGFDAPSSVKFVRAEVSQRRSSA